MPISNWGLEWLNANSQRRYPLTEDSSGVDTTGSFTLPEDFLVELDLPTHAGLDIDPARFFVRFIGAYATGYSVIVGYQPAAGSAINVATALIDRSSHTLNQLYALGGVAPFDDSFGKLVIGKLDSIDAQPPGFWEFTLGNARLEPDTIRPIIRGVSALTLLNGSQRSAPLYGDIELVAGENCQLVAITSPGEDPIIRISFVAGAGTIAECICSGESAPTPPIKTISGITPTESGDFTLIGSDCIQITPISNGLKVSNLCAKPCCGCAELEKITHDLNRLFDQAATVEDFTRRLQAEVTVLTTVVLGSKLNDTGCITC